MSRSKKFKNTPNKHENCVSVEKDSIRASAIKLKRENDKWEEKQKFVVLRPDHKTTIYRHLPDGRKVNNQNCEIHRGRI